MAARRRRMEAPTDGTSPEVVAVTQPATVVEEVHQLVPVTVHQALPREDTFAAYENLLKTCGPMSVYVYRLGANPGVWLLESQPRSGPELYAALKQLHGQSLESEYELKFHSGGEPRGVGHVTMPRMADAQPMQAPPPPYGQPPPQYQPPPQHYQQPVYAQQQPPAPPPSPSGYQQPPSAGMNWESFQAFQKQQFDLFLAAQRSGGTPMVAPPPPAPAPPLPSPPPPPQQQPATVQPGDSWSAFQAQQKQQWELFQEMQRAAAAAQQPTVQQQPAPVQQPAQQPLLQAPPGMVNVPGIGFVSAEKLLRVIADDGRSSGSGYRAPYGPRSPYYAGEQPPPPDPTAPQPQYGQPYRPPYGPQQPPQAAPQPKTAIETLREAVTLIRTVGEITEQTRPQVAPEVEPPDPADRSPVRVVDVGSAKMVLNESDGSTRLFESIVANVPTVFKFMGEQLDAIRKSQAEKEAREKQRQQLPPGYVEVGPGYVPPEGFVAVPVGQVPMQRQPAQQPLPDPPAQMPMPLEEEPAQRTWGAPLVSPGGS